jgi:hypothetical protein
VAGGSGAAAPGPVQAMASRKMTGTAAGENLDLISPTHDLANAAFFI